MQISRRSTFTGAGALAILGGAGRLAPAAADPGLGSSKAQTGPSEGDFEFDNGVPTPESVEQIFDMMDLQRATVAHSWAIPIVGMHSARQMLVENAGATAGGLVLVTGYRDVSVMLGSNVTTPYVFSFLDLSDGPVVVDYPAGATAGSLIDWWDRPLIDVGVAGPDAGRGATFLVVGPRQEIPDDYPAGVQVLHSRTTKVLMFCRGLDTELAKVEEVFSATSIYPYGGTPPQRTPLLRFQPHGRLESMRHPSGLEYWERLAEALRGETIEDRDRFFAAMLKPLGIEVDKAFIPDARQRRILEKAAELGEATALATAFAKRIPDMRYRDDTQWEFLIPQDYSNEQDVPGGTLFEERTAFFYEVTGTSAAVLSRTPGTGSGYLAAYRHTSGAAFDGGKTYRLVVPPNVPAKSFWSITLYDTQTRGLVENKQAIPDRSSRHDLQVNDDGSIEIVMGPTAPAGLEKNWIPTTRGSCWYSYFRLFGPLEPYFDRSWFLPDIEVVA